MSNFIGGRVTIEQINGMNEARFTELLGAVFEHSPWVAERSWNEGPFRDSGHLHETMMRQVEEAAPDEVLSLLRAHPDLATRLKVTALSAAEQQGAGLDALTQEEYDYFAEMNQAYKEKFGFPFILAVAGRTKADIAEAMGLRVESSREAERKRALAEISRIAEHRICRIVG
ncbi:2-oxo-4-hydroxy-4-carboxy-5-ureidoimidazoline decarboxylase [Paenibacillus rhizovicinus]|uniref:2-oxo-4-hydroxy-4-carboxy-5-ureidoimidazoline decarboxylase n=1 Tax=Paenibacillus rhizovicinus TaxID=2704463 RepID=A0A6C0NUN9_9BACL|nr:2-oxo-4-hydroxy-4-carboxy-5-ureidoimidazoline decarboxylase [Paenibacillus rhizovicinus]QHW29463.1 2-oxo-4-hydroxy-4-carboxy-5-ureidoimidazoline decarboxylase [Paenibacillus rhizovicinus]